MNGSGGERRSHMDHIMSVKSCERQFYPNRKIRDLEPSPPFCARNGKCLSHQGIRGREGECKRALFSGVLNNVYRLSCRAKRSTRRNGARRSQSMKISSCNARNLDRGHQGCFSTKRRRLLRTSRLQVIIHIRPGEEAAQRRLFPSKRKVAFRMIP